MDNKFSVAGWAACRLNPKPGVGDLSLQPGVTMSKDRIFETGLITLGVISTALAVWVIFSI